MAAVEKKNEAQQLADKMLKAQKQVGAGLNNYLKMLTEEFEKVSSGKEVK